MDNGGPAFVTTAPYTSEGMSLRDYFAASALQAFLSCPQFLSDLAEALQSKDPAKQREQTEKILASRAFRVADAMIAERNKS